MIYYVVAHVCVLALVLFFVLKCAKPDLRWVILITLLFKLTAGVLVGVLYHEYYEGGDTISLFQDSRQLGSMWLGNETDPSFRYADEPRAWQFVQWTAPLVLVCGGNYWLTSLWISFFAWGALWMLSVRLVKYLGQSSMLPVMVTFHIWPSFVFWTSGYLKESIAVVLMALIFMGLADLAYRKKTSIWMLLGLLAFLPLFLLKYYYAALIGGIILPGVLSLRLAGKQKAVIKYGLLFLFIAIGGTLMSRLHPNLSPQYFLNALVTNHDATVALSEPHKMIHFEGLKADWLSVVQHFPNAVMSGLFRPFLWEAYHPLSYVAAIENSLLMLMVVWSFIRQVKERCLPGFSGFVLILFVLVAAGLLAISSPNFGSLMRYKVVFIPVLVGMLLQGARHSSRKNM